MFFRFINYHFTPENHFGFEAAAWHRHSADVVAFPLFMCYFWGNMV
jgi:cytochrome c oxidase subunit 3